MVDATDPVLVEDDDDTLSSLLEKAEADALSAKRRKLDGEASEGREKGYYVAALKGSKCPQSQQQLFTTAKQSVAGNAVLTGGAAGGSGGGPCFKCGKLGHWACDCDALVGGGGGVGSGGGTKRENSGHSVVEKPCPCGLGTCLVLTANTEKNRGRKFYRCPVRQENGGCCFFEWCDNSLKTPIYNGAQIKQTNPSFPGLQCPCGAGRCSVFTAKTGKCLGQQFYRCPSNQGCGFFKWCSEHAPAAGLPMSSSQVYSSLNDTSRKGHHGSSSSCFKCRQEGHWAKDCPNTSSSPSAEVGARSDSSCFKCGQESHWAKDCPKLSSGPSAEVGARSGLSCFKCGQESHWAKDCPKPSSDSSTEVGARSGSSCFKCGQQGHWAKDCPKPSSEVAARFGSSGTCYKCHKPGHWASNCPG